MLSIFCSGGSSGVCLIMTLLSPFLAQALEKYLQAINSFLCVHPRHCELGILLYVGVQQFCK
jgi:hypothetical protein